MDKPKRAKLDVNGRPSKAARRGQPDDRRRRDGSEAPDPKGWTETDLMAALIEEVDGES